MAAARPTRVLIVEDNKALRRSFRLRLNAADDIVVIGDTGSGVQGVTIGRAERVDVVLMDLHLPDIDGVVATRALVVPGRAHNPKVILVTSEISDAFVLDAFEAGAAGYLLKGHDTEDLVEVIRGAVRGTTTISPRMTPRLLEELARRRPAPPDRDGIARLTASELRVVAALSSGVTANEAIAALLGISVNTVRTHVAASMRKLGAENRTQLALWGVRNDIPDRFA
jgi:DNA-binding NarL/FixJ family response regulator